MVGESLSLARCYRNTGVEVRVIPIYPPLPGQYKRVTKVVLKGPFSCTTTFTASVTASGLLLLTTGAGETELKACC